MIEPAHDHDLFITVHGDYDVFCSFAGNIPVRLYKNMFNTFVIGYGQLNEDLLDQKTFNSSDSAKDFFENFVPPKNKIAFAIILVTVYNDHPFHENDDYNDVLRQVWLWDVNKACYCMTIDESSTLYDRNIE